MCDESKEMVGWFLVYIQCFVKLIMSWKLALFACVPISFKFNEHNHLAVNCLYKSITAISIQVVSQAARNCYPSVLLLEVINVSEKA